MMITAKKASFFTLNDSGKRIAEISYVWTGEHKIIANHTWVDDTLRGHGVARQLLDVLVEFASKTIENCPDLFLCRCHV